MFCSQIFLLAPSSVSELALSVLPSAVMQAESCGRQKCVKKKAMSSRLTTHENREVRSGSRAGAVYQVGSDTGEESPVSPRAY